MRTLKVGRKEAVEQAEFLEFSKEPAALDSLIDYAIQCAMEARTLSADAASDNAKRYLCSTLLT